MLTSLDRGLRQCLEFMHWQGTLTFFRRSFGCLFMLVSRNWLEQVFVKTFGKLQFRMNKSGRAVAVTDI